MVYSVVWVFYKSYLCFQPEIPHMDGCLKDVSVSGRKLFLISDMNKLNAVAKCSKRVERGFFSKGEY